jgi:hypothetical protein
VRGGAELPVLVELRHERLGPVRHLVRVRGSVRVRVRGRVRGRVRVSVRVGVSRASS